MKITWTNCADAMPPINSIVLIRSEVTGMIKKLNGELVAVPKTEYLPEILKEQA